ncbi:MAG: carboxypeptidase regulatory-like domain-containing protein [Acidobacteriia bacterium]|nr:carboxypeptidase regulatory-like domain-containing protein [Terriglobia bacterium]
MLSIVRRIAVCALAILVLGTAPYVFSQSNNASIVGDITDPNGAVIQGAKVILESKDTKETSTFVSDANGLYSFRNVVPGTYQLTVTAQGFGDYVQDGILVRVGYPIRQNIQLKLATATQRVEVSADASPLNYENAELRGSIDPQVIQEVPLLVAGSMRSAANFASILPGVVRGSGDAAGAHVNGGQSQTGIVVLDGIALYNSSGTQGLTGAILDFPQSPDLISEFQVLTSNYDAQYGSAGGVTVENVRSGTNTFHGTAYEFNRNSSFNATQWGFPDKAKDIENDFGGNFGGPLKLPFWKNRDHRTFFFANFEAFRIRGALTQPRISIPSLVERQGDFRDWIDPDTGDLIPIYDPATHKQFMGCDGTTPNVICSTDPRLQNSLAQQWFQFLPPPSSPGPLNNYVAPATPAFLGTDAYSITEKIDEYIGSKDHISEMFYYKYLPRTTFTSLPATISDSGTSFKRTSVWRVAWDHTFSPKLVNHLAFGFQNDKFYGGGIDGDFADKLPQIAGVASHAYPPQIFFGDGFATFGTGAGDPNIQPWLAPAYIVNDAVSMTRGKHTISFGGEVRLAKNSAVFLGGQSGSFGFDRGETGLPNVVSGSPIASFLLEQVDSASANFYTSIGIDGRTNSFSLFVGDSWRVTPKLTISPGIHWEVDPPPLDAKDHFSYFDPNLPNPGAGNLPGAVAFAGSGPGRSGRRFPEDTWYGGIAPRIGVAYALTAKTVIRSGYGLFYDNANMPGWASGISQDGYNATAVFSSSSGGTQAAFILSDGLPPDHPVPPNLVSTFDNGGNTPVYRPRKANRLPYGQQWNLTVEHEFTGRDYVSASYVGTKGTRLLSQVSPINVVDPRFLALGAQLNDTFQPGDTEVDGVPAPFADFATVMTGCDPSVAQALRPFPQYCNSITGLNENQGSSTYHSFQLKAEHRLSKGLWALLSYTNSKLITNADLAQSFFASYFSPFQHSRNRSLALEDVPQALNIAYNYELPFGHGKAWLNQSGLANALLGGWTFNGVYRVQSGIPFQITSSNCNVPPQFIQFCVPALLPGASPFLQSPTHFDPSKPVLNVDSFEPASSFNFYTGTGPRVQNFRQPGFSDFDIGLQKMFHITERFTFQLRGDAFNVFNAHHFNSVGAFIQSSGNGGSSFNTDVASPDFGKWNGGVSSPRNIQVSGRISF